MITIPRISRGYHFKDSIAADIHCHHNIYDEFPGAIILELLEKPCNSWTSPL